MIKRVILAAIFCIATIFIVYGQNEQTTSKGAGVDIMFQYGAIGVMLVVGFWYILHVQKRHDKEIERRDTLIEKQFNTMNQQSKDTATILTELKVLIHQDILFRTAERKNSD